MTRTAAALIGLAAAVSASALFAAGPRADPAAGRVSPFDPAAGTGMAAILASGDARVAYFPDQFPGRGRGGVGPEEHAPTF